MSRAHTIRSKRENPPPAWAALGSPVIIIYAMRTGRTREQLAFLGKVTKVTSAGMITARKLQTLGGGYFKVVEDDTHAIPVDRWSGADALWPDTPENRERFALAFVAVQRREEERAASEARAAQEDADRIALRTRRREAIDWLLRDGALDDGAREMLTWARKQVEEETD